ncbi:surfeit locus protein 2 isoform X2 [Salvia hispanica]|uniref:surfeit locus protein 2 isoform X2 n=1 Tax=Salvia hispanica TaxID=49212 RepID=UPI0020094782|nr:surfeit locus protein 2 isoform X2 [Salvia hispanica]
MGKKKGEENHKSEEPKEGFNLLGKPKFKKLENGRFKCVETGHELPAHAREAYAVSKHCRLGLINAALARSKPPLNMFRQDPLSSSKLECKLTGLSINKSEEHIWKHMSGKRFLNMLEKFESEKEIPNGVEGNPDDDKEGTKTKKNEDGSLKKEKNKKKKKKEKKKKNKKEEKNVDEIVNEVRDSAGKSSDSEEDNFWMPPEGERWDQDDGGDRWSDGSESAPEDDDDVQEDAGDEEAEHEASELSNGTKRMSLETDPDTDPTCSAPKTKKRKTKAC